MTDAATPDTLTIANGGVTKSIPVAELTLDQLVQLSQGFGHQIDRLREKRQYLNAKIAERLSLMERTGDTSRKEGQARMAQHLAQLQMAEQAVARRDASAPGAILEVKAEG